MAMFSCPIFQSIHSNALTATSQQHPPLYKMVMFSCPIIQCVESNKINWNLPTTATSIWNGHVFLSHLWIHSLECSNSHLQTTPNSIYNGHVFQSHLYWLTYKLIEISQQWPPLYIIYYLRMEMYVFLSGLSSDPLKPPYKIDQLWVFHIHDFLSQLSLIHWLIHKHFY